MKQLSLGLVSDTRVSSSPQSGGVSGCNTPTTILDAHTRNLQNTNPLKKNVGETTAPTCCLVKSSWLETTRVLKCLYTKCFVQC